MNENPIMRRCKDDWVNATQILKCCNFPKAKRTKILEKGVQQSQHEKVQGGFGRFQGTWIPLEDARKLAANYGVTKEVAPVLYLDLNDPNLVIPEKPKPPPKPKEVNGEKRKYTKKPKQPGDTPRKYKTGKKAELQRQEEEAAAAAAVAQESFTSQDTTFNSLSRQISTYTNNSQYPSMYNMSQTSTIQHSHSQPQPVAYSQPEFTPIASSMPSYPPNNNFPYQQPPQPPQPPPPPPPPQYPQKFFQNNVQHVFNKVPSSQSSNDTNWSTQKDSDTSMSSNQEDPKRLQQNSGSSPSDDNSYAGQLLKFFSADNAEVPYFIHYPPADFKINEPIDDEGHSPLHWAASIGNYNMIHLLISKGAHQLVVNNNGLNPLSKLLSFTNCFELKNFPKVLNELENCLINTDINGRTPLHYLCSYAKSAKRYESIKYYLQIILAKLTVLSHQNQSRQIDLMKNVLNHQDIHGDTCLHLAIKSGLVKIVKTLLEYGARDDLENINRETSKGLIQQYQLIPNYLNNQFHDQLQMGLNYTGYNVNTNNVPGLATPIQPNYNKVETPDTQRTTIQDDDLDDEEINSARVDNKHIDMLQDNKENIFIEKYNVSTPVPKTMPTYNHQPLSVISEIEPDKPKETTFKFIPPKINNEGKLEQIQSKQLSSKDLSSMISSMINSLSDCFENETKKLDHEIKKIEKLIKQKKHESKHNLSKFEKLLHNSGIEEKITSFEEGEALIQNNILKLENTINEKDHKLLKILQFNQAFQLGNLIQDLEMKYLENNKEISDDELSNEDKFDYSIELTNLQIKRKYLIEQITQRTKDFGIDDKMYKYRKLLSLSCGIKVEDIDSLIDSIAEELAS
ncbi:unnamed protein product [Candida verbasci]|uniref:HTH APSES-type domain-containing protein n=1 Tax=Candida verbasci TaxID=1227364 RepID=A0A9W4TXS0_9ASCO|nr:unnamed protein product [Candida verbasci]